MSVEPVPDWLRPESGFTAPDLDNLPGLPPHTELIDGGLVFMSPQRRFHDRVLFRLQVGLVATVSPDLDVAREMSVILDEHQRPEPDLSIVEVAALGDGTETWYPASAVRVVIEVVSPSSQVRDRERKPQLYAKAGIQHFWRVEESEGKPVVYVYELDPATSTYALTGIHHERLKLSVPFNIDIDLADVMGGTAG
jgi:Uma2 family endonuclease